MYRGPRPPEKGAAEIDARDAARLKRSLKKLEEAGVEAFHPERFPQDDRLRCQSCSQVFWPGSRKRTWYQCPNGCRPKTDAEEALVLLQAGLPLGRTGRNPPQPRSNPYNEVASYNRSRRRVTE